MNAMNAVLLHEFGPPSNLVCEQVPRPSPGGGDVLIRVYAAGVNPVDAKIRAGGYESKFPVKLPAILGWDVSGVIEEIGADVKDFSVGDEVFSRPNIARPGCYAEYVAVAASELARKPSSVDHIRAASVPLAAVTAWQAIFDHGGLSAGQTVLVHAAAGGVGIFAVQLARWCGATVYGTASASNREFIESLGCHAIDYQSQRFEDVVPKVDLVLDSMGGETYERSWEVLKEGGTLVSLVTPTAAEDGAKRGKRGVIFMMQPNAAELSEIGSLIDQGQVKTTVDEVFALADTAKAHELIEKHHTRGKIVLSVA